MFSGNLADLPLVSLLQALTASSRTGVLKVEYMGVGGQLFLQQGRILHCEMKPHDGEYALSFMLGLPNGLFRFEDEVTPPNVTLIDTLETRYRLAEEAQAWRALRLPNWKDVLREKNSAQGITLSPSEHKVVSLAPGRSVLELLRTPDLSPLDAARALDHLLRIGILEARAPLVIPTAKLVVLSLYGNGEGAAFIDEELFLDWSRLLKRPFDIRLKFAGGPKGVVGRTLPGLGRERDDEVLSVKPRANFTERLGLFDKDMRRLRLSRGISIEVQPEIGGV